MRRVERERERDLLLRCVLGPRGEGDDVVRIGARCLAFGFADAVDEECCAGGAVLPLASCMVVGSDCCGEEQAVVVVVAGVVVVVVGEVTGLCWGLCGVRTAVMVRCVVENLGRALNATTQ